MGVNLNSDDMDDDANLAAMSEINVTPFVDVMLVLLIVFMVAAPLMIAGVPVNLPQTAAARQNPPQKPIVVTIAADSALYIRDLKVERGELSANLSKLRATEGDAVAYVRADKAITHGDVMDILGKVGEAGYSRISLLSQGAKGNAGLPAR